MERIKLGSLRVTDPELRALFDLKQRVREKHGDCPPIEAHETRDEYMQRLRDALAADSLPPFARPDPGIVILD